MSPTYADPVSVNFFQLSVTGQTNLYISSVSGLGKSVEMTTSFTNDAMGQPQRQRTIGKTTYNSITCTGVVTDNKDVFDWMDMVAEDGQQTAATRVCELMLFDAGNVMQAMWILQGAIPVSLDMEALSTGGGTGHVGFTLTLDVESVKRMK